MNPNRKHLWIIFLIAAVGIIIWLPSLRNENFMDDGPQVTFLELPKGLWEWVTAWFEPWWPHDPERRLWRPVTRMALLIQKAAFGQNLIFYHCVSLLLNIVISLSFWKAAQKLGFSLIASTLAALLFCIHPIHSEVIHQIVGQAELIAALMMLLGLWAYSKTELSRKRDWLVQAMCFLLALGAKEHSVVYPCLIYLTHMALHHHESSSNKTLALNTITSLRLLRLSLIFFIILIFFILGRRYVTGGWIELSQTIPWTENPMAQMSFGNRLPAVLGIFAYMIWSFLGISLTAGDYSAISFPFNAGWGWPLSFLGLLILLGLISWGIISWYRGKAAWLLILSGFCIWLPTSNLFIIIGTVAAERLWYFLSIIVCLGIGWSLGRLNFAKIGKFVSIFYLLLCSLMSLSYASAWKSSESFSYWTLKHFPDSWRANNNYARAMYLRQDYEAGLTHARLAVKIAPDKAISWDWLGLNAMFLEDAQLEAEIAFKQSLKLNSELYEVWRHLANLYEMQGRHKESIEMLEQYLKSNPPDRKKIELRIQKLR